MGTTFRRIAFLVIAIGTLALYYIYADFHTKMRNKEVLATKRILQLAEGEEIQRIVLGTDREQVLEVAKRENHWQVEKPVSYPADDFIVDGLVTALTNTTAERSFQARDLDLGEMGLESPSQKVAVGIRSQTDQEDEKTLRIGREVPAGGFVYAQWEGGQEVFMLHETFARSMDKSLYSVRKKMIFDLSADEVYAVDVTLADKSFILLHRDGKWLLVSRESESVDQTRVETFVSRITAIYAKEFLDSIKADNPELDLSSRKYSISLTDRAGVTATLWIGKESKEKESFFALKDGEGTVLLVSSSQLGEIPQPVHFIKRKKNDTMGSKPLLKPGGPVLNKEEQWAKAGKSAGP